MKQDTPTIARRFDLDWLRIFAILAIFIFHSGRFFDPFDWHVKNPVTHSELQIMTMFLSNWGMPLIFVISGASLYFSLVKIRKFIMDKILRLLVPLVVGILTHVALAVYLERLTHYQFIGSFFEFYPRYFDGFYGDGGNFAWMGLHLWYLLVLFVFSIVFLPVFYLLKGRGKQILDWVGNFLSLPGMFYLLAAPIAWIMIKADPYSTLGERSWGGWNLLGYVPFFFYGFLLISHASFQESIKHCRWLSLALALSCTIVLLYFFNQYGNANFGSLEYAITNGLLSLNAWLWIVTIFGFGMKHLNFHSNFLLYASEAVLPFYILHQTVLLSVGYYITRWNIPDVAKFFVIALGSFALTVTIYEFLIRRVNILRVLFGMKMRAKPQTANTRTVKHMDAEA